MSETISKSLLNIDELIQWLNVKESTIRKWTCRKKIPYIKVGGAVRFRREDIQAWLDSRDMRNTDNITRAYLSTERK